MTRYYVTMTWEDWPEGGSYGTVVEADSSEDAEAKVRREMAETRAMDDTDADEILSLWGDSWHVVDCYDLDEFIADNLAADTREPAVPTTAHRIRDEDVETGRLLDRTLATVYLASVESVRTVLGAEVGDPDGRSEFVWVRLANGDLVLGIFPCGDTYFNVEVDAHYRED